MPREPDRFAEDLTPSIERELHRLAGLQMRRERRGHTLQTTAIVNEAWLRLQRAQHCGDRNHFLALASQIMRRILIDHARAKQAGKRAGVEVSVDSTVVAEGPFQPHILDVHSALETLALIAPRQAQLVELRFFGGLPLDEAASVLGISDRTADKDWKLARAWLRKRLDARRRDKDK